MRRGCFAFAVLCFLFSCWGVGFSTGGRLLRAVPSVPTLPLLGQLLWAGAWLEQLLVRLLFPASLLLWLLVDLCSSCPARAFCPRADALLPQHRPSLSRQPPFPSGSLSPPQLCRRRRRARSGCGAGSVGPLSSRLAPAVTGSGQSRAGFHTGPGQLSPAPASCCPWYSV